MTNKPFFSVSVAAIALLLLAIGIFPVRRAYQQGLTSGQIMAVDAIPAKISYQGLLTEGGSPANGSRNMVFRLFTTSDCSGTALATITKNNVSVQDGLFHVVLDINPAHFNGQALRLRVTVGSTNLGCEEILPAPYALFSASTGSLHMRPVSAVAPATNQVLRWSGTEWTPVAHNDHNHFGQSWSGSSANGLLVTNSSTTGRAIAGVNSAASGETYGVAGAASSTAGYGGYFINETTGHAVVGLQTGYSVTDNTFWTPGGLFGGRNGVVGISKTPGGYGIMAWNQDTGTNSSSHALFAYTQAPNAYAGYFLSSGNGVFVSTPAGKTGLTVVNGSKNAAVATDDGARLLYSEESTEVWFTDYGFGRLERGVAVITIDPLYAQTVNLSKPYHVFTEVYGPARIYVVNRTPTQFEVRLLEGESDVEFSYRIVAKRLGYEDHRLERAPLAVDNDPNLYPDKSHEFPQQPLSQE